MAQKGPKRVQKGGGTRKGPKRALGRKKAVFRLFLGKNPPTQWAKNDPTRIPLIFFGPIWVLHQGPPLGKAKKGQKASGIPKGKNRWSARKGGVPPPGGVPRGGGYPPKGAFLGLKWAFFGPKRGTKIENFGASEKEA
jgi:hypothetical protein